MSIKSPFSALLKSEAETTISKLTRLGMPHANRMASILSAAGSAVNGYTGEEQLTAMAELQYASLLVLGEHLAADENRLQSIERKLKKQSAPSSFDHLKEGRLKTFVTTFHAISSPLTPWRYAIVLLAFSPHLPQILDLLKKVASL